MNNFAVASLLRGDLRLRKIKLDQLQRSLY